MSEQTYEGAVERGSKVSRAELVSDRLVRTNDQVVRAIEQMDRRVAQCIRPNFKVVLNYSIVFVIVFIVVVGGGRVGSGGAGGGGGTHWVEMILNRGK